LKFFQEAAPPVAFLLQKQIFSGTFRSGDRGGRMMGAFQIFKRPWSSWFDVWAFRVIHCDHLENLGFPSVMKVLTVIHREEHGIDNF